MADKDITFELTEGWSIGYFPGGGYLIEASTNRALFITNNAAAMLQTLAARLADAEATLRDIEWACEDFGPGHLMCPVCGAPKRDGVHRDFCRIGQWQALAPASSPDAAAAQEP